MKYAIRSESFVVESIYRTTDALTGKVNAELRKGSAVIQYMTSFLQTINSYIGKLSVAQNRYADVYFDYLNYKENYNSKMSFRKWCRHEALVQGYSDANDNVEQQPMQNDCSQKPFHLNVKEVKCFPVWSSNLEDIDIINRQN